MIVGDQSRHWPQGTDLIQALTSPQSRFPTHPTLPGRQCLRDLPEAGSRGQCQVRLPAIQMQQGVFGAIRLADRRCIVVARHGRPQVNTRQVELARRQQPDTGPAAYGKDQQPESGPAKREIGGQRRGRGIPGGNHARGGHFVPPIWASAAGPDTTIRKCHGSQEFTWVIPDGSPDLRFAVETNGPGRGAAPEGFVSGPKRGPRIVRIT